MAEQIVRTIKVTVDGDVRTCTVFLNPIDYRGVHYTGNVDGFPFRYLFAGRVTAEKELAKAERTAAAWRVILDTYVP